MPNNISNGVTVALSELLTLRGEAKHLDLAPRGKVLATRSGGHLSRFRGRGMEFDESRPYQPGDEVRNMDWRVTARAGTPHVKLFREERERPVWLLVDLGPSMRFGTRVAFKSVVAARAAALLGWAAADRGDRVGGLIFDEAFHFERRPAARMRGLLPLLQALTRKATTTTAPPYQNGKGGYSSLTEAALHLQHQARPGSLVFILSDFAGVERGHQAWLSQLGMACELVLIHLYDPLEELAPPPGLYPVTNGSSRGILATTNSTTRKLWQQRFAKRLDLLEELTHRHQAHLLNLSTNVPLGDALASGLRPRLSRAR